MARATVPPPPVDDAPWWQRAVFYQVYPRSFADTDGDGVGDLAGIRAHLADLVWLGVDALWISPFFRSPMADFGYDVSDYCDVDPLFGDLATFDALVAEAHALGLRVVIDWVPNHSSDRHPWFVDAASSRHSGHRSWYVWRDPKPDGSPPNNWVAAFDLTAPAWTFHEATGQWYLHLFESAQPDLNWDEPAVEAAMHGTLRFWLDRGVDGFRADVVHGIGKDPDLPDDPPGMAGVPHCALNDVPVTHERLRTIRTLLDAYPGDRMMVGEVFLLTTEAVAAYYGDGDELHLAFNFPPLFAPWLADRWTACIEETARWLDPRGAWPTWVLSNHDNPRHRTRYDRGAAAGGRGPGDHGAPQRAAGTGRRRPPPHPARDPVRLPGRRTRPRGRHRPRGPSGRPGRTGRLPGADPVERRAGPRLADARRRVAVAPVPTASRHAEPGGPGRRPGIDPAPLPARPGRAAGHPAAGSREPTVLGVAGGDPGLPTGARHRRLHRGRQFHLGGGRRVRRRHGRHRGAPGVRRHRAPAVVGPARARSGRGPARPTDRGHPGRRHCS